MGKGTPAPAPAVCRPCGLTLASGIKPPARVKTELGSDLTSGDQSGKQPVTILGTSNKNPSILLDVTTIDTVRTDLLSFFAMYNP
jgi:hypothetical protein